MSGKFTLLAVGEFLWDVYPGDLVPGGAPFNFAAHFSILGGRSRFCTGIGWDELGNMAYDCLRTYGVETGCITWNSLPTGRCEVRLDGCGVPSYRLLNEVAYDCIDPPDEQEWHADVLYFGTLMQRSAHNRGTLRRLLEAGRFQEVFCDLNIRGDNGGAAAVETCLRSATLLKFSEEEEGVLYGLTDTPCGAGEMLMRRLAAAYPNLKVILRTRGEQGAQAYAAEQGCLYDSGPVEAVQVVSTVGAGDSFGACFLYKYLLGDSLPDCLQAAAAWSGQVVQYREAIPPTLMTAGKQTSETKSKDGHGTALLD